MSTLLTKPVFDDVELDVLLYMFSYLSVFGHPPTSVNVREAVGEPTAVDRLLARRYIHATDAVLVPDRERIQQVLTCV